MYVVTYAWGGYESRHRSLPRAIEAARRICRQNGIDPDDSESLGQAGDLLPSIEDDSGRVAKVEYSGWAQLHHGQWVRAASVPT